MRCNCRIVVSLIFFTLAHDVRANERGDPTPRVTVRMPDNSMESHFRFGEILGNKFSEKIASRFDANSNLKEVRDWISSTSAGSEAYAQFLETHERVYPLYVEELRGIAEGSGRPFEEIFAMNLILEFSTVSQRGERKVDGCSDYMLCSDSSCVLGHNEDNDATSLNNTYIVTASFGKDKEFTGFTYAGDLTSGAFGFSRSGGFAFTLNWVGPTDVLSGGLGRGFISRSMMDSENFDDAVRRATTGGQSCGHNYNIMDLAQRRIVNIESAPGLTYGLQEVTNAPFFHANQYELLKIPETYGNSSVHRIARVAELEKPTNASDILHILGDQKDVQYPLFHDEISHARGELSDWTMATALFDLDAHTMTMYHGNPRNGDIMYTFDIGTS